jgi:putative ribosome biogenesis GTPase RsgA
MLGAVPFLLLINKSDLTDQWSLENEELEELRNSGWQMLLTSAKTGSGVEEAFLTLAQKMLEA